MPVLTATDRQGRAHSIAGEVGDSLMVIMKYKGGLDVAADCGGSAACGTCHVVVAQPWVERLPALSEAEDAVLDGLVHRQDNSRLACQVPFSDALDGLLLTLAESE